MLISPGTEEERKMVHNLLHLSQKEEFFHKFSSNSISSSLNVQSVHFIVRLSPDSCNTLGNKKVGGNTSYSSFHDGGGIGLYLVNAL